MSEIITLSSDEEEVELPPPKKKAKIVSSEEVSLVTEINENRSDVVILSDDEIEDNISCTSQNGQCEAATENHCFVKVLDEVNENSVVNDNQTKNSITDELPKDESNTKASANIIIDENSSEDSSGKENKIENELHTIDDLNEPSTSSEVSMKKNLLEEFLDLCGEVIANSAYEHLKKKFARIRWYYRKCEAKLRDSSNFSKLIEANMTRAQKSPATAVISFHEIFQYVKDLAGAESLEVSEEHKRKLKHLERTLKLLVKKIKQLENTELDFDDEENSTYLQLDRFTNRLNKVYAKYCELLNKNPYSGRITHEKLDFVDSEYNEINRAISKQYKNNEKFPSYFEMEKYIRTVVANHNLDLSETKIKTESIRCFKKLGELLQHRRKKELYDSHYLYVRDSEDPAKTDQSLDTTLKQNFVEGQVKIEKICEEFRIKEEIGDEVVLSEEDSDRSEEDSSDVEENDN